MPGPADGRHMTPFRVRPEGRILQHGAEGITQQRQDFRGHAGRHVEPLPDIEVGFEDMDHLAVDPGFYQIDEAGHLAQVLPHHHKGAGEIGLVANAGLFSPIAESGEVGHEPLEQILSGDVAIGLSGRGVDRDVERDVAVVHEPLLPGRAEQGAVGGEVYPHAGMVFLDMVEYPLVLGVEQGLAPAVQLYCCGVGQSVGQRNEVLEREILVDAVLTRTSLGAENAPQIAPGAGGNLDERRIGGEGGLLPGGFEVVQSAVDLTAPAVYLGSLRNGQLLFLLRRF